jgi:hypothetical protein
VDPPAISTLPEDALPICTRPVDPASRVKLDVPPAEILPAPAKPSEVAETEIVSIDETEDSAPELITIPLIVLVAVGATIARVVISAPVESNEDLKYLVFLFRLFP